MNPSHEFEDFVALKLSIVSTCDPANWYLCFCRHVTKTPSQWQYVGKEDKSKHINTLYVWKGLRGESELAYSVVRHTSWLSSHSHKYGTLRWMKLICESTPTSCTKKTQLLNITIFWPTAPQQLRNWRLVLSGIDLHATSPKPFSKFEIGNTSVPKKYKVYISQKLTKTPINPNSIESVLLAKILLLFCSR